MKIGPASLALLSCFAWVPLAFGAEPTAARVQGLIEGERVREQGTSDTPGAREFTTRELPGGLAHAVNSRSGLEVMFTPEGTRLERLGRSDWAARLRLERFGRAGSMEAVGHDGASVEGARVAFDHAGGLTQWYVNASSGLEHGFTLARRPDGDARTLRLEVSVEGARVTAQGGGALAFVSQGEAVMYTDLRAWDALDRPVPVSMRPGAGGFVLELDDSGARYPVTVDPTFVQAAKFTSSNPTTNGRFGQLVEVTADRIVASAAYEEVNGLADAGAVYVFERDPAGGWGAPVRLIASTPRRGAQFGRETRAFDDMIVVSAPFAQLSLGSDAGEVHVFERDLAGAWGPPTTFVPDVTISDTWFGFDLQATRDRIVVPAPRERRNGQANAGTVYIYERDAAGGWATTRLFPPGVPSSNRFFGSDVAASDTRVVVSSPNPNAGIVYMYEPDASGAWVQVEVFTGPGGRAFGSPLHVEDDRIVVGAMNTSLGGQDRAGAVYVLERDASGVWAPAVQLTSSAPAEDVRFGKSFGVAGDLIVVNAPEEPTNGFTNSGAVYAFEPDAAGVWGVSATWTSDTPATQAYFGKNVSVLDGLVAIEAERDDVGAQQKAGAVHVYEKDAAGAWSRTLFTSNSPGTRYGFGSPIDVSQDRIIVGASEDDVGSNQRAGAVYVYDRGPAGAWGPPTRLLSSDPTLSSDFGAFFTVVGGARVIVAARYQTVDGNGFAGDVHVFDEDASGAWSAPRRLVSDNPSGNAQFGAEVASSGDVVVVNASNETVNGVFSAGAVYVFDDVFVLTGVPDDANTDEDTTVTIDVLANDEINGAAVVSTLANFSAGGSASVDASNRVVYTPAPDFGGVETFDYTVTEGGASQTASVTVVVAPVNDLPVAAAGLEVTTDEDTAATFALGGTDVEDAPNLLTFAALDGAHGRVRVNGQMATYTPDQDFAGQDTFAFTVTDSEGGVSLEGVVDVTVEGINDPPMADAQSLEVAEDASLAISLTGSDVEGDALTFRVTAQPVNGVLAGAPPDITYTPGADFAGADAIRFVASDGALDSSEVTVSVTVTPVNDAPVAQDATLATQTGAATPVELRATDADGDPLTYLVGEPSNGALSGIAPSLTYTPDEGFEGQDTFTFSASDGVLTSQLASVVVVVSDTPNVAPRFTDPTPAEGTAFAVTEGDVAAFTIAAQDEDSGPLALTLALEGLPGEASFDGLTGRFTWQTTQGDAGSYALVASASDGLARTERQLVVTVSTGGGGEDAGPSGDAGADVGGADAGDAGLDRRAGSADEGCCATAPSRRPGAPLIPLAMSMALVALARRPRARVARVTMNRAR